MSAAVVIRAFNEEAHIGRLLTGINHQTLQPEQVIVVDSGSTDATVPIAEAFGATIVPIEPREFSFGRALNRGLEAANAELAVFASAHVFPIYDDWLQLLLEPFADDQVGASFGRQTVPPDGRFSERRLLEQWFPERSRRESENPFCNNANAAIRRELWLDHPYDERLTGLEDLAWGKALISRGIELAYVAQAPVIHVHDESLRQVVNRYRREAIAHKLIYPEQSFDAGTALRLGLVNVVRDALAARRERRLSANLRGIVGFRAAQFYGTLQGFSQSGPVTEGLKRRFYYPPVPSEEAVNHQPSGNVIDYDAALEHR